MASLGGKFMEGDSGGNRGQFCGGCCGLRVKGSGDYLFAGLLFNTDPDTSMANHKVSHT